MQSHIHSAVCDGLLPDISKLGRALALHAWMARLMSPVWEDSKLFKHALAQQVIRFGFVLILVGFACMLDFHDQALV